MALEQYEKTISFEADQKFVDQYRALDDRWEEAKCRYRAAIKGTPGVEAMVRHSLEADRVEREMDDLSMEFCKRLLGLKDISFDRLGGFSVSASGRLIQINVL